MNLNIINLETDGGVVHEMTNVKSNISLMYIMDSTLTVHIRCVSRICYLSCFSLTGAFCLLILILHKKCVARIKKTGFSLFCFSGFCLFVVKI